MKQYAAHPASGIALRASLPSLAESRWARTITIVVLYFMQGVPLGLSLVAIPAWLAAKGSTPTAIGVFVGTALLPWSLKLVNGLLMDRFTFRPMGRRRSWILVAQAMMAATLIALALAAPSAAQITTLAAFCFALNLCATFNDVAVDGMAIDIVPDEDRTMINGLMFASQTVGVSATSFVAGQLLLSGTVASTALVLAGFVIVASAMVGIFRERPGERLMPWSRGRASAECQALQHDAWRPIVAGVLRTFASPLTLLFLAGVGLSQASWSFIDAVSPTLAVQQLGWGSDQFSSYSALVGLCAAGAAALLTPVLVRVFALRRTLVTMFLLNAATAAIAAATYGDHPDERIFALVFATLYVASLMLNILQIVWSMRICNPAVAASQFALFMAVPNFSRSLMSGNSGPLVENAGYGLTYLAVAVLMLAGLAFCILGRVGDDRAHAELDDTA